MKRLFEANSRFWILILVLSCAVFLWPLVAHSGFFISDDGEWMIIRLSAFYQSLAEGQFPVRFLGRLNNSYGYPVANFLYPGFLYLGSVLHLAGLSFVASVKLILAGSIIGTCTALYFLLRQYKHHRLTAAAGAIGFLLSPYVGFDLYRRGSVGEILAFFSGSLVLYALVARKKLLLPFAVAFLIVSHNSIALLVLAACGFYIAYRKEWRAVWPIILGAGLSAFFWIPALLERSYVIFGSVAVSNPTSYFPISLLLIASSWVWIVASMLLIGKRRMKDEGFWLVLLAASVALATPISGFLWRFPPLGQLVQFPFRFLGLAAMAAPVVVAGSLGAVGKKKTIVSVFYVAACIVVAARILSTVDYVTRPEGYYTTNEATTTVANEYMPTWVHEVPRSRAAARIEIANGDAEFTITRQTTQTIDVAIDAKTDSIIQINTIYYPGWGVVVDGEHTPIDYTNPHGLMRVLVPTGKHRLVAEFRETVMRFGADIVTFLSIAVYALALVAGLRKKR